MPDPTFASVSAPRSKEGMGHVVCKTDPADPIWSTVRVWANASGLVKQAGVQESSGPVSGRTQPARYQFPTFTETRFRSSQMSGILLCKTSSDPTYFRPLSVSGFGQMDPVWKQANVQESSGPLLANVSQPIRTGCESDPACFLDYYISE